MDYRATLLASQQAAPKSKGCEMRQKGMNMLSISEIRTNGGTQARAELHDRTVGEYYPDPSLGDAEIATIARWVDGGAPKGDPADAPAPRVFPPANSWVFGEEPDLVVNSSGFNVPAVAADQYPKIDVPTGLTEDRYIKWMQVIPEDPKVLHHVLIFSDWFSFSD